MIPNSKKNKELINATYNLRQLKRLELYCKQYNLANPRNHGTYSDIGHLINLDIRNGIIFYSRGHGWQLRKKWEEVISYKRQVYQSIINELSLPLNHFVELSSDSPIGACGFSTQNAVSDWDFVTCPICYLVHNR